MVGINTALNNRFKADFYAPNKLSRNIIIGGDFTTNPWQRQVSVAAIANAIFVADRFQFRNTSAAVVTVQKTADAPTVAEAGIYSNACLEMLITTADTSIDPGDILYTQYTIEGYDLTRIFNRPFTISFWVKATKPGIYSVGFANSPITNSYIAEYTVLSANTWEKKVITVSAQPTGTWAFDNTAGMRIYFAMAIGSTFQTTPGSWQVGNFIGSVNQVNGADTVNNSLKINLVQLETGLIETPFEVKKEDKVLAQCQRYYFKTFPQGVYPAQNTGVFAGALTYRTTNAGASANGAYLRYPVVMRNTPTTVTYSPGLATGQWYNQTQSIASGNPQAVSNSTRGLFVTNVTAVSGAIGDQCAIHLQASSEI